MSEAKDVERPSVQLAEATGWMCRKLDVGRGSKGWLDQLMLGPNGAHFIVEFKDFDGTLSPKQAERIKTLRRRGHTVYVCDNYNVFTSILGYENKKAASLAGKRVDDENPYY